MARLRVGRLLFDTRNGTLLPRARVNGQLDVAVTGRNGVLPAGVSAVALVVTGTEPVGSSFVTTWATGAAFPPTSTISLTAPRTPAPTAIRTLVQ